MPRASRHRRIIVLAALAAAVVLVGVVIVASSMPQGALVAGARPPGIGTVVVVPADSKAQAAFDAGGADADATAAAAAAARYLASQPTAYWLTPEQNPPGTVGATVASLNSQAREQDAYLAIVIYGLPERDCGNHSAGGLSDGDYPNWITEIAAALEASPDVQRIVVLEPDSLGLARECGNLAERVRQLRRAVAELSAPDTWIYLDGGHSNWLPATEMADLIAQVDVGDQVRGFATNVSNYQSTAAEFRYAHELSTQLDGMHAIVDTSRNGVATAGSDWCNPPGQRVGDAGGTHGDDVVDTNLWIKPPGESDGPCNGGPAAGAWWPKVAITLTQGER